MAGASTAVSAGGGVKASPQDTKSEEAKKKPPKSAEPGTRYTAMPGSRGKLGFGASIEYSGAQQHQVIFRPAVRYFPFLNRFYVDFGFPLRFFPVGDDIHGSSTETVNEEQAERLLAQPNATDPTGPTAHHQGARVTHGKVDNRFGFGPEIGVGYLHPWGKSGPLSRISSGVAAAFGLALFHRRTADALVELQFETPESILERTCDDPDAFGGTGGDCNLPPEDPVRSDFTLRGKTEWPVTGVTANARVTVAEVRVTPALSAEAFAGVEYINTEADDGAVGLRAGIGATYSIGAKPFKGSKVERPEIASFTATPATAKPGDKVVLGVQYKKAKPDRETITITGKVDGKDVKKEFEGKGGLALQKANQFLADNTAKLSGAFKVRIVAERDGEEAKAETQFTVEAKPEAPKSDVKPIGESAIAEGPATNDY